MYHKVNKVSEKLVELSRFRCIPKGRIANKRNAKSLATRLMFSHTLVVRNLASRHDKRL